MATLTAGQNSSFKGFAAAGNAIGLPTFGSFDTAPFAGVTTQYIYTTDGTNGSIGLTGNQSPSFFGGQIYVDGVAWAVTYTAYDGTHTSYSLTPANGMHGRSLLPVLVALNVVLLAVGWLSTRALHLGPDDATAIAIETGTWTGGTAPADVAPQALTDAPFEEFDLDDIEIIESKVFA